MLITAIILACAYFFIAGQYYSFIENNDPSQPMLKQVLISLAWPVNVSVYLLLRCVR